ncbi:hypothetical protein [Rhodomicrobium lacus]|uniref:hypothetical protein n=1 Tax=Rhodomicrobium lacus TaxID=2498452 RepID=UPI0013DF91B7|nr:hypothetical protein [Rhodomicrobium lacus]
MINHYRTQLDAHDIDAFATACYWLDLGQEDTFEARLAGTRLLALATAAYRGVPDAW